MRWIWIGVCCGMLAACQAPQSPAQQVVFDELWEAFQEQYPYFTHKQVDWELVQDLYRPQIGEPLSPDSLFARLTASLGTLADIHIYLGKTDQQFQYEKRSQYPSNPAIFALHYLDSIYYQNNRVLYGDLRGDSLAYLRIRSFEGSVNNYTIFPDETIISSLVGKKGLIIDLRDNPGGKEDFAVDFASRFVQEPRPYKRSRYRNGPGPDEFGPWQTASLAPVEPIDFPHPITLLTNRGCYSATESFVLMMKSLPQVRVFGDTTGGASGNPIAGQLSNGWHYTLPTVQAATLDYQLIEDRGLPPDSLIQMSRSALAVGRDEILEAAMGR